MEDAFGKRETLTVTHNHPYLRAANDNGPGILNAVRLDPGGDWSAAGLLRPGDRVQSGRGAHLEVIAVEPVAGLAAKVYNFEVADHHTYAIGELQAWAHNAGPKRMTPIPGATGPHWTYKYDPCGQICQAEYWVPNPRNPTGFQSAYRIKMCGKPHGGQQPPLIIYPGGKAGPLF